MKNIYDLIDKGILVREPVDEICEKIISSQHKKIILTGGRGVGKTVVLNTLENRCLGTKNPCITMNFEAAGLGINFEEKFYIHYYELIFCSKLLNYIKQNYTLTYNRCFKKYGLNVTTYLDEMYDYINNFLYKDIQIDRYFGRGELSSEILNKFQEVLKLETLTLAIDRFDWTLNGNPVAQKVLSNYFAMFDKMIITSDDEEFRKKEGYSIINIDYNKDIEVVKEIISKYVISYNTGKSGNEQLPVDLITDEIYLTLIEKTSGNVEVMLEIIKEVIIGWEWDCKDFNIKEEFDKETKYKVKSFNEVMEISSKTKLYL